jgi:hypothetical protein
VTVEDVQESPDDDLGIATELLFERGAVQAAALLIDASATDMSFVDVAVLDDGSDFAIFSAAIDVPTFVHSRFTDEILEEIRGALNEVMERKGGHISNLRVRPVLPERRANWRESLQGRMAPRVSNQAGIGPRMTELIVEDRCQFRSKAELEVYRALKRLWAKMPQHDMMSIAPNPALVVPNMNTMEPDFLVMYRGRVGMLQVDDPHHRGRLADEVSRDRVYKQSGIFDVDRVVVEDTTDPAELDRLVAGFVRRLAGRNYGPVPAVALVPGGLLLPEHRSAKMAVPHRPNCPRPVWNGDALLRIARGKRVVPATDGVAVADLAVRTVNTDLTAADVAHDLVGPLHGLALGPRVRRRAARARRLHVPAGPALARHNVPVVALTHQDSLTHPPEWGRRTAPRRATSTPRV